MKGYKGFNEDLTCKGFQFKEGETFKHIGEVDRCHRGFHFCKNPLDLFNYYPPNTSIYHNVTANGQFDEDVKDSKVACSEIKIGARISVPALVDAGVNFILSNIKKTKKATNTGYQSAATNTGYRSAATNTGDQSAAMNTGYRSAATNTGDRSAATNTGYQSAAMNTGYQSAAMNTGYQSAANVEGNESIAFAMGYGSKAKGKKGCWLVLTEWKENHIIHCKLRKVDGKKIKEDTWYQLKNNKFVKAD